MPISKATRNIAKQNRDRQGLVLPPRQGPIPFAAGQSYTPLSLDNLFEWWDPYTLSVNPGEKIGAITGKRRSLVAQQDTDANRPVLHSVNGRPFIKFENARATQLRVANFLSFDSEPVTVFCVFQLQTFVSSGETLLQLRSDGTYPAVYRGNGSILSGYSTGHTSNAAGIALDKTYLIVTGFNESASYQRVNGVDTTNWVSSPPTPLFTANTIALGNRYTPDSVYGANALIGDVGLVVGELLTGSSLTDLESFLIKKWSIT